MSLSALSGIVVNNSETGIEYEIILSDNGTARYLPTSSTLMWKICSYDNLSNEIVTDVDALYTHWFTKEYVAEPILNLNAYYIANGNLGFTLILSPQVSSSNTYAYYPIMPEVSGYNTFKIYVSAVSATTVYATDSALSAIETNVIEIADNLFSETTGNYQVVEGIGTPTGIYLDWNSTPPSSFLTIPCEINYFNGTISVNLTNYTNSIPPSAFPTNLFYTNLSTVYIDYIANYATPLNTIVAYASASNLIFNVLNNDKKTFYIECSSTISNVDPFSAIFRPKSISGSEISYNYNVASLSTYFDDGSQTLKLDDNRIISWRGEQLIPTDNPQVSVKFLNSMTQDIFNIYNTTVTAYAVSSDYVQIMSNDPDPSTYSISSYFYESETYSNPRFENVCRRIPFVYTFAYDPIVAEDLYIETVSETLTSTLLHVNRKLITQSNNSYLLPVEHPLQWYQTGTFPTTSLTACSGINTNNYFDTNLYNCFNTINLTGLAGILSTVNLLSAGSVGLTAITGQDTYYGFDYLNVSYGGDTETVYTFNVAYSGTPFENSSAAIDTYTFQIYSAPTAVQISAVSFDNEPFTRSLTAKILKSASGVLVPMHPLNVVKWDVIDSVLGDSLLFNLDGSEYNGNFATDTIVVKISTDTFDLVTTSAVYCTFVLQGSVYNAYDATYNYITSGTKNVVTDTFPSTALYTLNLKTNFENSSAITDMYRVTSNNYVLSTIDNSYFTGSEVVTGIRIINFGDGRTTNQPITSVIYTSPTPSTYTITFTRSGVSANTWLSSHSFEDIIDLHFISKFLESDFIVFPTYVFTGSSTQVVNSLITPVTTFGASAYNHGHTEPFILSAYEPNTETFIWKASNEVLTQTTSSTIYNLNTQTTGIPIELRVFNSEMPATMPATYKRDIDGETVYYPNVRSTNFTDRELRLQMLENVLTGASFYSTFENDYSNLANILNETSILTGASGGLDVTFDIDRFSVDNNAIQFNATYVPSTSSYVGSKLQYYQTIINTLSGFTVGFWINMPNILPPMYHVELGVGQPTLFTNNGRLGAYLSKHGTSGWDFFDSGTLLTANQWAFLATTFNLEASTVNMYVNGQLDTSHTRTGPMTSWPWNDDAVHDIAIGGRGGVYTNGSIDDVFVLNYPLDDEAIQRIYNENFSHNILRENLRMIAYETPVLNINNHSNNFIITNVYTVTAISDLGFLPTSPIVNNNAVYYWALSTPQWITTNENEEFSETLTLGTDDRITGVIKYGSVEPLVLSLTTVSYIGIPTSFAPHDWGNIITTSITSVNINYQTVPKLTFNATDVYNLTGTEITIFNNTVSSPLVCAFYFGDGNGVTYHLTSYDDFNISGYNAVGTYDFSITGVLVNGNTYVDSTNNGVIILSEYVSFNPDINRVFGAETLKLPMSYEQVLIPQNEWGIADNFNRSIKRLSENLNYMIFMTEFYSLPPIDFIGWLGLYYDGPYQSDFKFGWNNYDTTNYYSTTAAVLSSDIFYVDEIFVSNGLLYISNGTQLKIYDQNYYTNELATIERRTYDDYFGDITSFDLDSTNRIFILDGINNRIIAFEKYSNDINSTKYLYHWGGYGTANSKYKFNNPTDLIVDVSDNVWILDAGNRCIKKYIKTGEWLQTLVIEETGFNSLISIAIDSNNDLHVLADNKVLKYSNEGTFITSYTVINDNNETPQKIISMQGGGFMYICHETSVEKVKENGDYAGSFGKEIINAKFTGIYHDINRNFYICNGKNVLKYFESNVINRNTESLLDQNLWTVDDLLVDSEEFIQDWVANISFKRLWDNIELFRRSLIGKIEYTTNSRGFDEIVVANFTPTEYQNLTIVPKEDIFVGRNEYVTADVLNRCIKQLYNSMNILVEHI